MRIRRVISTALATAVATGVLVAGAVSAAPMVAPVVAPSPAPIVQTVAIGSCPHGTILIPRAGAAAEYRRAHRFGVRQHFTRAQLRRLVVCAGMPTVTPAPPSPTPTVAPAAWQEDMLARINTLRNGVGAGPVEACAPITAAAQAYADAMARTGVFAHVGTDGSEPWDRMRANGYRWMRATENIAKGYPDVVSVIAGWMASPGHRENLLDPDVRHVGLGLAVDGAGTHWWVQDFGAGGTC